MPISSVGTVMYQGSAGTNPAVKGKIKSISVDGASTSAIDVTGISSQFKEYVCGMLDGGTITVSCFAEDNSSNVPDMVVAGDNTVTRYRILYGGGGANGFTVAFDGYLTTTTLGASVDEAVTLEYKFRVSGHFEVTNA